MANEQRKNWRELCRAALEAKDPDELLQIVQELNIALKIGRTSSSCFQARHGTGQAFRGNAGLTAD